MTKLGCPQGFHGKCHKEEDCHCHLAIIQAISELPLPNRDYRYVFILRIKINIKKEIKFTYILEF